MKITKFLTVALGLFLMGNVNVNVVLAQEENMEKNDSIYGLEVSRENGAISFYSTYDMNNAKRIHVLSYDEISNDLLTWIVSFREESDLNSIVIKEMDAGIPWICVKTEENIYKLSVHSDFFIRWLIPEDKLTRIELYIEGEGFIPPTDGLSETIGKSNVLTFFFNPVTTSLMELETDKNYIYKYFLLSGKESQEIPVGVPFIQMIYINNTLVHSNKSLVQR